MRILSRIITVGLMLILRVHHYTDIRPSVAVAASPGKTVTSGSGKVVNAGFGTALWRIFDVTDGLADNYVRSILQDREGYLWFGTSGGVSRYDGQTFTTFATKDGLAANSVRSILQDREGYLWFGTSNGVSRYDGQAFTNFSTKDGLADNDVISIVQDREGYLWFGTPNGVSRYDGQTFTTFTTRNGLASNRVMCIFLDQEGFLWFGTSGGVSRYDGQAFTNFSTKDGLADNYVLSILQDREGHLWFATRGGVSRYDGQTFTTFSTKDGLADNNVRSTLHDMQMGLMPRDIPQVQGLDIDGRCIPAMLVGGDFFQYFHQSEGRLTLTLADVTGHGMGAAIPVVMFSGILKSEMRHDSMINTTFQNLNRALHEVLDSRTFICFEMAEVDISTRTLCLSNGGCPFPFHFRAETGTVEELQVIAYPLGVQPNTEYEVLETQLQSGDRVVFCSDGIIEAENASGEQFGFGRTPEVIRQACEDNLSAEATIDRIFEAVNTFKGDAHQGDDMTCVVLRVE